MEYEGQRKVVRLELIRRWGFIAIMRHIKPRFADDNKDPVPADPVHSRSFVVPGPNLMTVNRKTIITFKELPVKPSFADPKPALRHTCSCQ